MTYYEDCPCGYPTVKFKVKEQSDLTKLYALNEYQKSFTARATFKVILIDTFNINIQFSIPADVALIMNFSLHDIDKEINKELLGKRADWITVHTIALQILAPKFNRRFIGISLAKDIEDLLQERRR